MDLSGVCDGFSCALFDAPSARFSLVVAESNSVPQWGAIHRFLNLTAGLYICVAFNGSFEK
jgi:hypothetical protein